MGDVTSCDAYKHRDNPSSQQTLKSLDQRRLSYVYAHGGLLMRTISRRTMCSEVAF